MPQRRCRLSDDKHGAAGRGRREPGVEHLGARVGASWVAAHTHFSRAEVVALSDDQIATLRDPRGSGAWFVPVVSSAVPWASRRSRGHPRGVPECDIDTGVGECFHHAPFAPACFAEGFAMATAEFQFHEPFPLAKDATVYRLLTKDGVSVATFDGQDVLKVKPEALRVSLGRGDARGLVPPAPGALREGRRHPGRPRVVAATTAASQWPCCATPRSRPRVLPFCQDTGTATVVGKKGQQVWTGGDDEQDISAASTRRTPRRTCATRRPPPLTMYEEINTG